MKYFNGIHMFPRLQHLRGPNSKSRSQRALSKFKPHFCQNCIHDLSHQLSSSPSLQPRALCSPPLARRPLHAPPAPAAHAAPSAPSSSTPLKDVTNGGQGTNRLVRSFSREEEGPGRGQGPSGGGLTVVATPGSLSMGALDAQPEGAALHNGQAGAAGEDQLPRERAATYCVAEGERLRKRASESGSGGASPRHAASGLASSDSIEHIAHEFLDPTLLGIREAKASKISPSSSTKSKDTLCCKTSTCSSKPKNSSPSTTTSTAQPPTTAATAAASPASPKSPERRRRAKGMGTIGVLCKQSMSFDLGVSLRATSPDAQPRRPLSAESISTGGAEARAAERQRPASTGSDQEAAAAADDKKKSARSRFLDSSWLQKPKKFFKVSK